MKHLVHILFFLGQMSQFLFGHEAHFSSLEEDYTPSYCLQLEAAYGPGMMSEGGTAGIEHMFHSLPLEKKKALDIGSGLGGVAFYLADQFSMNITGIEVNPWMVKEAKDRIPAHLRDQVDFSLTTANSGWPFPSDEYDIVYSKGVLTHIQNKEEIFQECYRVLNSGGYLVITDWLSSEQKVWGENIQRLVELENLVLYPESQASYIELLEKSGYKLLTARDDTDLYYQFNKQIIDHLQTSNQEDTPQFNESERKAAIEGYEAIVKALEIGELKVFNFVAQKDPLIK